MQDGIGFEDERGNLCVGHEIPGGAQRLQQGEHTLDVIGARFQYLHDRLRQPGADVTGGLALVHGLFEHASARANQ